MSNVAAAPSRKIIESIRVISEPGASIVIKEITLTKVQQARLVVNRLPGVRPPVLAPREQPRRGLAR